MDLRSVLSLPAAYRLFARSVKKNRCMETYVSEYIRPKPGDKVLDIGCGPGDILEYLPDVEYFGIDISPEYIEAARARYGARGIFACTALKDFVVDHAGAYDIVTANGVVHHLDDEEAATLFRLGHEALRPGGRLVTSDGCFVAGQSPVARLLLSMDRGRYVRQSDEYIRLARTAFEGVQASIRHDLLRFPFTHIMLECAAGALPPSGVSQGASHSAA